ncbi:hypothetical protein [Ideonella livida]|uniref:Uncharacterized protein n=1 Tax=Ideonella livida TaxID=2707176 RepID=A0A7C9PJP3_9BURK|nr:hypothetical protein [Ideonella livida]NDY93389.1 hypothetical protein [Ideonella livida]
MRIVRSLIVVPLVLSGLASCAFTPLGLQASASHATPPTGAGPATGAPTAGDVTLAAAPATGGR